MLLLPGATPKHRLAGMVAWVPAILQLPEGQGCVDLGGIDGVLGHCEQFAASAAQMANRAGVEDVDEIDDRGIQFGQREEPAKPQPEPTPNAARAPTSILALSRALRTRVGIIAGL